MRRETELKWGRDLVGIGSGPVSSVQILVRGRLPVLEFSTDRDEGEGP